MLLGLLCMCAIASEAIDASKEKAAIKADSAKYVAREAAESAKFVARETTHREIATTQIQWDAMRDIECMRAQAQVITANTKCGFYESLFARQATPELVINDAPAASSTKRFCSYCGERLNEGVRFCSSCGKRI